MNDAQRAQREADIHASNLESLIAEIIGWDHGLSPLEALVTASKKIQRLKLLDTREEEEDDLYESHAILPHEAVQRMQEWGEATPSVRSIEVTSQGVNGWFVAVLATDEDEGGLLHDDMVEKLDLPFHTSFAVHFEFMIFRKSEASGRDGFMDLDDVVEIYRK